MLLKYSNEIVLLAEDFQIHFSIVIGKGGAEVG